jgi:hypothetical protein
MSNTSLWGKEMERGNTCESFADILFSSSSMVLKVPRFFFSNSLHQKRVEKQLLSARRKSDITEVTTLTTVTVAGEGID